jgi:hypothetical protein
MNFYDYHVFYVNEIISTKTCDFSAGTILEWFAYKQLVLVSQLSKLLNDFQIQKMFLL